jgi:GTP diphosphokinase / guanosine-3',5'-bis(diphosphate) 3'-diphosphatase
MNFNFLIHAIDFAADKHKYQRRKGYLKIPYINHPVKVCKLIADCGETDIDLLIASILHDVVEDTDTSETEIAERFGTKVAQIVMEVTDNMKLPEKERKELQVIKAPGLSREAKLIKIADKACNMHDILNYPLSWTRKRKLYYFNWSFRVFEGCRGLNNQLDNIFIEYYKKGIETYSK